jgi:hypothetical protein
MKNSRIARLVLLLATASPLLALEPQSSKKPVPGATEKLQGEADAVRPFVKTTLAKAFVEAAAQLPEVAPRKIYRDDTAKKTYSAAQRDKMSPEEQKKLREINVDGSLYYYTKYGSPLAYCRALDILGENGVKSAAGMRIADYGYGGVGHLRMLASLGADVTGIDVDPFLTAVYCHPEDQGPVKSNAKAGGRIKLLEGLWPKDEAVETQAGSNWDLFISKNTLKNGYIHPAKPVDKRMLVDLSVGEEAFVKQVYAHLKPGGYMFIFNICPAPAAADKPYIPWADGTCPFPRDMLTSAEFKVIAFDQKDDGAVRQMAHLLGWDEGEGAMNLKDDLFAWYTLAQRPQK